MTSSILQLAPRNSKLAAESMTTVRSTPRSGFGRLHVEGKLRWAVLLALTLVAPAAGQEPVRHWRHAGAMPPGAIGRQRLMRGEPLSGYCQAVEIRAPQGARIAPAAGATSVRASKTANRSLPSTCSRPEPLRIVERTVVIESVASREF